MTFADLGGALPNAAHRYAEQSCTILPLVVQEGEKGAGAPSLLRFIYPVPPD
jgi:hypothetical protein